MKPSIQKVLVSATILSGLACACGSSASDNSATHGASTGGASGSAAQSGGGAGGGTVTATGGSAASSAAGASASGAPVGDGQAFVPSTIVFNSVDTNLSTQYKLLTATVRDYGDFIALLVSVRNDSGAILCNPTFNAAFQTATSNSGQAVVPLSSAMYQSNGGSAEPCVEPGAIGYGASPVSFDLPVQLSDIQSIDYEPQGTLDPVTPTKITNVELGALAVSTLPGGGYAVGGSLMNLGTIALNNVTVSFLALDSGGRPYDFDGASTDSPVLGGATWAFTLQNISSLGKYMAFAQFSVAHP